MRKLLCAISMAALLVSMTACNSSQDNFTPDYESAIGAIFINNEQELPENTKVYADFADNSYSFDLDAACVYYFSASADVAYAGDQNFTSMTLGQTWTMIPWVLKAR